MDDEVIALAQTIPTWKVCQRFYPGVAVTSTQAGPDAAEVVAWPEDFAAPSPETLFGHRLTMAREFLDSAYQRNRAAAYLPTGDTLDGILKALAAIRDQGIAALPEDTCRVLDHWQAVKSDHPKPTGAADAALSA